VHPPKPPSQPGEPLAPPLYPTSTFSFTDADEFARASERKVDAGYVYGRWANPTVDAFEAAIADLEGAEHAEAFSSGMAAIFGTFLALCSSGDRIVAARQLYGQTHSLLSNRLPAYGISSDQFDVDDFAGIEKAVEGASMLYCETIGNPRVEAADLPRLAAIAHSSGVPLVVDNTFASPVVCRPLELGASIVVHSATKYLGGHHDLIGGVACTSAEHIDALRAVARDMGPTMSPFDAWLLLRGIQTLHLRVDRACESAMEIALFLESDPSIDAVYYPAIDPDRAVARTVLGDRGGGMLGFDVAGGRARARRFQEALRVVTPAASLGGTHSLIVHAASVTHTQLGPEELAAAGITEGFCRLSVGVEDADDLLEDLDRALRASEVVRDR
jgi:cystathionine beta-lyase/cystathionine gamma-synthase